MTFQDNVVTLQKPERDRLVCTACLANVEVTCDCGAEHKRMTPGELARVAVEKYPNLSNRLIAERVGVDEKTVRKARASLPSAAKAADDEFREGQDGVLRRVRPSKGIDESKLETALPRTPEEEARNLFDVLSVFADNAMEHSPANCSGGYLDCTILENYYTESEIRELGNKCLNPGKYWMMQGHHLLSLKGRKT